MAEHPFEIRPIAGALGAEIAGIDLSEDIADGAIAAIRRTWLDHLVVFFRGQTLPPERLLSFARRFGEVVEYPFIKGIEGFPEAAVVATPDTLYFGTGLEAVPPSERAAVMDRAVDYLLRP